MKIQRALTCAVLGICLVCVEADGATTAVYDHFDNGVLDPAWSVSYQLSTGWSYTESGTNLTAADITPTVVFSSTYGPAGTVTLSRTFAPLADFAVDFDFSWMSEGKDRRGAREASRSRPAGLPASVCAGDREPPRRKNRREG